MTGKGYHFLLLCRALGTLLMAAEGMLGSADQLGYFHGKWAFCGRQDEIVGTAY
jgi:hypothetical protein